MRDPLEMRGGVHQQNYGSRQREGLRLRMTTAAADAAVVVVTVVVAVVVVVVVVVLCVVDVSPNCIRVYTNARM